jgi:hypothetical protein
MLPQVVARQLTDLGVDRDAAHHREERMQSSVLLRPGTVPQFCNGHRRAQEHTFAPAEFIPAGENDIVPTSRNLDQNIGVNQNGRQEAILLSRFPLRSRRT